MRHIKHGLAAALLAAAPLPAAHASGGGAVKAGPEGIPFSCSDGRSMRVVYGREGPKAKAKLLFGDSETYELNPAPTIMDRRYTAEGSAGQTFVWATNGIDAIFSEASADGAERELARCRRDGWNGGVSHHQDDHGSGHDSEDGSH
jgi:hypothetical protein